MKSKTTKQSKGKSFVTMTLKLFAYLFLYIPGYFFGLLILLPYKKFITVQDKSKANTTAKNYNLIYAFAPIVVYEIIQLFVFFYVSGFLLGSTEQYLKGLYIFLLFQLPIAIGFFGSIWLKITSKEYENWFYETGFQSSFYDTKGKEIKMKADTEYINLTPNRKKKRVLIERKALKQHMAIIGTTGSGKTETAKHFLLDQFEQNQPTIYIDGKGDQGLKKDLKKFCETTGQKFYVFTIDKLLGSNIYNGLNGTPKAITQKLISFFGLGDSTGAADYFNTKAKNHLEWLVRALFNKNKKITLIDLLNSFDPSDLFELAKTQEGQFLTTELKKMRGTDDKDLEGLYGKLLELYNNTKETMTGDGFTVEQALKENAFVLFSLNSLDYETLAGSLGKFIVSDLKQSATINGELGKETLLVLDEFNVFANDNVIDLLNKTRSFGYRVMLLFQSLADLSKVSEHFQEQVLGNTNTKIVMKITDNKTKKYFVDGSGASIEISKSYDGAGEHTKYMEQQKNTISMEQLNSFAIGDCIISTIVSNSPLYYNKTTKLGLVKLPSVNND